MLHVDYKKPYGYYTLTQGENKLKIYLCKANTTWAEMYFYKNDKGVKMAQLSSFLGDAQHLKNCLKNNSTYLEACDNYVFNAKEVKESHYAGEIWKTIRILAENGKKVTIK